MAKSKAKAEPATCFVDAHGGALAALAAGVAVTMGDPQRVPQTPPVQTPSVLAATTSKAVMVPVEIAAVLAEIGASAPPVVLASALPAGVEHVDLDNWGLSLHEGEGDLERLAVARIARDRIERRLTAAHKR